MKMTRRGGRCSFLKHPVAKELWIRKREGVGAEAAEESLSARENLPKRVEKGKTFQTCWISG